MQQQRAASLNSYLKGEEKSAAVISLLRNVPTFFCKSKKMRRAFS